MSIRTRRLLFYISSFLFLIISSLLVAYSLGFKLDFTNLSFRETGGIYLRSEPTDASISLDGKEIKNQSGFLQSGTLISNLKEDSYHLNLERDGYFNWEKNVSVKKSLVEVFDSIVLVSQKEPDKLSEPVDKFYINDGSLITEAAGGIKTGGNKLLGDSVIDTADDGTVITYNSVSKIYYLYNIFIPSTALNISTLFNNLKESRLGLIGAVPIVKVAIHPFNRDRLIIQSRGALYTLDTARLTIEQIAEAPVDFKTKGQEVVFYGKDSLYKYSLIFRTVSKINALEIDEIKNWELGSDGKVVILFKNGELSVFSDNEVFNIADKAALFALASDNETIAFLDYDGPLYVYKLDKEKYLKLESGINETISDLSWYKDNEHLFIKADRSLYFTEVDERLPLNTTRLGTDISEYDYKPNEDSLYFLTPKGIFKSEI